MADPAYGHILSPKGHRTVCGAPLPVRGMLNTVAAFKLLYPQFQCPDCLEWLHA